MINERFQTYFKETFFAQDEKGFKDFLENLEKPIPRTIRIKREKIDAVKAHLEGDGWILLPTSIDTVFELDRREDFHAFERRIGFSVDHLAGNFYIQEFAAAHPVHILANAKENTDEFLILDMASSPGGKTTQLREYFPNSFIIANEPTRERIPQLLQNLERMGTPNVGVTLYPGQFWKEHTEIFDRILLDAPCSGEGTLYKGTDATKHWHIKNIKNIAHLQTKLLDAAVHALKVGGEMVYSTCSLNLLENEEVINSVREKYGSALEILFEKKFWPHIDRTGGFFITKIRKVEHLPKKENVRKRSGNNEKIKKFRGTLGGFREKPGIELYEYENKILAVQNTKALGAVGEDIFFMRFGEYIGKKEGGEFLPHVWSYKYLEDTKKQITVRSIEDEEELDLYLRGYMLSSHDGEKPFVEIQFRGTPLAREIQNREYIENTFPKEWQRK